MDFIFEFLVEVVVQLFFEIVGESMTASFAKRPPNRWFALAGCLLFGSLLGLVVTMVFQKPFLDGPVTGISVVISPLVTAFAMQEISRWRGKVGHPGTLASFSGAWTFATGYSLCRVWILMQSGASSGSLPS